MHKSYFTQAMLDHPVEPLRSPYAPSFLAACRCASLIIQLVETQFRRYPTYAARLWNNWGRSRSLLPLNAFRSDVFLQPTCLLHRRSYRCWSLASRAFIFSSHIVSMPNHVLHRSSSMAPSAFAELGIAIDLFTTHASSCSRARNGLVSPAPSQHTSSLRLTPLLGTSHANEGQSSRVILAVQCRQPFEAFLHRERRPSDLRWPDARTSQQTHVVPDEQRRTTPRPHPIQ